MPQPFETIIGHDDADDTTSPTDPNMEHILATGGRFQDTTTLVAPKVISPKDDPSLTDDAGVRKLIHGRSSYVRENASKATFRYVPVTQTLPMQLLSYDPNRKVARLFVVVAQPLLLGPEAELSNYVGAGTVTSPVGAIWVPGVVSVYPFEYTAVTELWALAASATPSAVNVINETYGGSPGLG